MQRRVLIITLIITAGLLLFVACETPRDDADPQEGTTAERTSPDDTATAPPEEVQRGDGETSDEHVSEHYPRGDGERVTAGPGVSLQTILDQAYSRDPQTEQLTILERLNDPQAIDREPRENRHVPNQIDTLKTYRYEGLHLRVYDVTDGKEILERVTVTSGAYETEDGLSVGITRSELELQRGEPDQRREDTYIYDLGGELPTMLHVALSGDTVSRLEWRYPVD